MLDLARQKRPGQTVELTEEVGGDEPAQGPEAVVSGELKAVLERFEEKLKPAYRSYFHAVFVEGRDWEEARVELKLSRLRTKYLKSVLLKLLQRHGPLLEVLGRGRSAS
jgi:DNA-directed RNA polymerase specialized sigma24 family protein